jgi:16S rRNA (adenine1518-N6/adenine1519-N6)-dimethyltransferase
LTQTARYRSTEESLTLTRTLRCGNLPQGSLRVSTRRLWSIGPRYGLLPYRNFLAEFHRLPGAFPMTDAPRQTISYLSRRFREVGIEPNHRHGQNFLVDLNILDLIADRAEIAPDDVCLEVGCGAGSLTSRLASRAAHVVSVEIDARMHQIASEELASFSNISLLRLDALKSKHQIAPEVAEAVEEHLGGTARLLLVANLPYHIATPLLVNLLIWKYVPASMTVTIQKEVAERLLAAPSTHDYGSLSVFVQALADVEMVRVLPPSVFWPRPKVDSAVVRIVPNQEKRRRIADVHAFQEFLRAAFAHRRKMLRGVLNSSLPEGFDRSRVDAVLQELGVSPTARAEEIDVPTWIRLFDSLRVAA